ncbi:MAG: hypothetical protein JO061_03720, partial [Acidobacteriaceae bacterium]|nr:hypothetical protein [Acidobacteriaceae bacterium]
MKRRIYISHLDDALRRISIILPLVCSFCGAHAGAQTRPSVTVSPSTTVPSILGCRNFSGLVCAGIPSFAAQNGMSPDWTDIYNALQLCASEGSSTAPCTVFLTPGSYYLTKTLQIPSNTILSSTNNVLGGNVTLYRDWADVPGEGQYMGPVISMSGTNVTIEHLAINGLDHPFYSGDQSNNVNVLVQNCINCVVEGVDSSHSRVASIRVMDGNQYLSITGCAIHDNGQPGVDASGNSLRSDGLAVTRVAGTSSIQSNTFWNNTDMNLILGGGMTGTSLQPVNLNNPPATLSKVYCSPPGFQNPPGLISMCMSVINNIIYADNASNANINQGPLARPVNSALLLDRSGLTGAGIMFDNEDGWSPNCQGDAPNSTPQNPVPSCADFTGFYIN